MIQGTGAIALNLMSILFINLLLIVIVAAIISSMMGNFNLARYSLAARQRILWITALTPWIIGILTACLSVFIDGRYFSFANGIELFHWHHTSEFKLTSWHGLSVLLGVAIISLLILKAAIRLIANAQQLKLLYQLAEGEESGLFQLDSNSAAAFTAGIFKPRCYITNGLRRQLNEQEFKIIQLHESTHAKRFDPLKKWLFQLLTSFFSRAMSSQMNRSMTLAMELSADANVARIIKDKSLIAETLLKVKKLSTADTGGNDLAAATCHYALDDVEERINYLINRHKESAFPLFLFLPAIAILSVISGLAADLFHHFIEFTLSH